MTPLIVLDANAAVEMVRGTQEGAAMERLILDQEERIAPAFYQIEVRNTFWKYVRFASMAESEGLMHIADAMGLIDRFYPIEPIVDEAFLEALRQQHPIYDMLYLCLARRHDATVFTLDRKLQDACIEAGVNCICAVDF